MVAPRDVRDLPVAALRTWGGPRGLARRAGYEASKRSGRLRAAESSALARSTTGVVIGTAGVAPLHHPDPAGAGPDDAGIRLYGALEVDRPPDWHRHPFTGHVFPADVHWSELRDSEAEAGDVKDVWETARLGWLMPSVRRWAADGDERAAEQIWSVLEDWVSANPPYRGPGWMCGQETSLRAITVLFLADALRSSPATTDARRALVADLLGRSVGRVRPTLGYALSQRNNHSISESGFLWTAAVLAPSLPDAEAIRRRAARALTESVGDQIAPDGSYAQHSPTYQRLALHVLLWCLLVARTTGEEVPPGVVDAVGRSVGFLRALVAPGSEGRVPNLGGNDGALLFDLAGAPIGDLRPVIAHAAAATGQPSGFGPGPWDDEARWFGLQPTAGGAAPPAAAIATHALTQGTTHAVVRAGPLAHRPAHADQLHTDVWLAGAAVAVDPGSYRYTAPPPWGNALAEEDVHNLPRRPGVPQAVRAGRFFWRRWAEAVVDLSAATPAGSVLLARLVLPDGAVLRRLVAVAPGLVVVVDQGDDPTCVRWNLVEVATTELGEGRTTVAGAGWAAVFRHGPGAAVPERSRDDPTSGWQAPTYGVLEPVTPLLLAPGSDGRIVSTFGPRRPDALASVAEVAHRIDLSRVDERVIDRLTRAL